MVPCLVPDVHMATVGGAVNTAWEKGQSAGPSEIRNALQAGK